jgi:lipopolysaccharide transport system ATP-binding protein
MKKILIACKNIYKKYPNNFLSRRFIKNKTSREYALKNISFDIFEGDSIALIGNNGSGKSTLMSILMGVSYPTSGFIDRNETSITGLLKLRAGFNGDLSGLENIYLYGSIIGMTIKQINLNLNKILRFSELGDSIHNKLNQYSSGMISRLAFSISIYSSQKILLIDEVLAVGDIHFQEKCINFLKEFKVNGGTLIIVSHNLNRIQDLCDKAILLNDGKIKINNSFMKVKKLYEKL